MPRENVLAVLKPKISAFQLTKRVKVEGQS
ncbi:hypothetical protein FX988_03892 [Paraglaciecola mesophila]|uniref:Uncharacterized protein n=1 Tax=Paraglaciecola mesophila TaxID=197222 RepID=A0A857JQ73_9ALTE|nr:hypothetical protein FX988_03892 [Paraglaciecola mesophila]